ncbi:hypothetical protein [Fructobacillus fructosus]
MTKKFTEEEYQKIVDCFDELNEKYNMGLLASNLVDEVFKKFIRDYDYQLYWQEIVAIMNPITRDEAHEKFVEKEKKYYWKTKKTDRHGKPRRLAKDEDGAIYFIGMVMKLGHTSKITETELREWGYNPDMYDKEDVE